MGNEKVSNFALAFGKGPSEAPLRKPRNDENSPPAPAYAGLELKAPRGHRGGPLKKKFQKNLVVSKILPNFAEHFDG